MESVMDLVLDLHTHTLASGHAYSTIEENAKKAIRKGLALMAMTDHSHMMPGGAPDIYFANLEAIPDFLVDDETGKSIELLKGVETNIIYQCGEYTLDIELTKKRFKALKIVIASLHPPCIAFGTKKENTDAVIAAMKSGVVTIIGHPGDPRYPLDMDAVTYTAKQTGVFLEINNHSLMPDGFRSGGEELLAEMISFCRKLDHPVAVGSDAHFSASVGDFQFARKLLLDTGVEERLVLNTSVALLKSHLEK